MHAAVTSFAHSSYDTSSGPDHAEPLGPSRLDKALVFLILSIGVHAWALSQGLSWLTPDFSLDSRSSPVSDQGVQVQLVSASSRPEPAPAPVSTAPAPESIPAPVAAAAPSTETAPAPPKPEVIVSQAPAQHQHAVAVPTNAQTSKARPKPIKNPVRPAAKPLPDAAAPAQPAPPIEAINVAAASAPAVSAPLLQTEGSAAPREVRNVSCEIPQPRYPIESRRNREQGLVVLRAVIDVNGDIEKVQIAQSSGYGALDRAAGHALQRARCAPYIDNGQRIAVAARLPVAFNLNSSR